jgi:putative membrane protein
MSDPPRSPEETSTELSSRRTGMSFQRTRLSADRTLMAAIRTSLSLIGFGFTIFKFFEGLRDAGTLQHSAAPEHFGVILVLIGICLLLVAIVYQVRFMYGLRTLREQMTAEGLIHGQSGFPASYTMVVAVLLLLLGGVAVLSMTLGVGPLSLN